MRDLSERGVIGGQPGAYRQQGDIVDANVPATLQATIGARIDRLDPTAKNTLNAAAVIGARFDDELLALLIDSPDLPPLIEVELINQVAFGPRPEYAFRHPLVRTVAYESQLKSDRMQRHRILAAMIGARGSIDENAALIAEHLEAAGDVRAAYDWHMRAGAWSIYRDIAAARTSWRRAQRLADELPDDDPDRLSMRIATRTQLAGTAWRVGGGLADPHFDELRELCAAADDRQSLAIGLGGVVTQHIMNARREEASRLATELVGQLELIGIPTLTIAMSVAAMAAKHEAAEVAELMRLAEGAIDAIEVAGGDPAVGNLVFETPLPFALAARGIARFSMGIAGWRDDFEDAINMTHKMIDAVTVSAVTWWTYGCAIAYGVLLPDATALRATTENLASAEQSADDFALDTARLCRAVTLLHCGGPEREAGLDLLENIRVKARNELFVVTTLPIAEIHIAREMTRRGDVDGAIALAGPVSDELLGAGKCIWTGLAVGVLAEALVERGGRDDLEHAQAVMDRLAAVPTDPGFVLNEITLLRLRAMLARARGDVDAYREHRERYRKTAVELGFEGHIAMAEAMT